MSRRRTRNHHLPPGVILRYGRYYYGRNQIALGANFGEMLQRYADLRGAVAVRAKAASDSDSLEDANALLAHAQMQTTSIYRRRVAGRSAKPVMRKIKGG